MTSGRSPSPGSTGPTTWAPPTFASSGSRRAISVPWPIWPAPSRPGTSDPRGYERCHARGHPAQVRRDGARRGREPQGAALLARGPGRAAGDDGALRRSQAAVERRAVHVLHQSPARHRRHVVELATGVEQTPISFYVITRASLELFGNGTVALRLPALLGYLLMSICVFRFVDDVPRLCTGWWPCSFRLPRSLTATRTRRAPTASCWVSRPRRFSAGSWLSRDPTAGWRRSGRP